MEMAKVQRGTKIHGTALVRDKLGFRQVQVLWHVRQTLETSGLAPSYRQMCRDLDINGTGNMSRIVKSLENKGFVERAGSGRTIRIKLKEQ